MSSIDPTAVGVDYPVIQIEAMHFANKLQICPVLKPSIKITAAEDMPNWGKALLYSY